MTDSMLAAVHAASADTAAAAAPAAPAEPTAPRAVTRQDVPADVAAAIRAEGAAAERERILGIEAHALPGHESLVSEMKADGKTTPDQAAGRLLAAHKAGLARQSKAIADDDAHVAGLTAPAAPVATATAKTYPQTEEGWTAEWSDSKDLQAQYIKPAHYVSAKKRESKAAA